MKTLLNKLTFIALLAFVFIFQSCDSDDNDTTPDVVLPTTIVDVAIATPELSSLVAALQAADMDLPSVLSGTGPFTVLAPSNEAFADFLSDNNFSGLSDVPTDVLTQILLNHVISGQVTASTLISDGSGYTKTLATGVGESTMSLYYDTSDGVRFNGVSSVTAADVEASNGVIHLVDAVIGLPTVVDFAQADPAFETLVAALTRDDLQTNFVEILSSTDSELAPFTVFAPTNEAFGALLEELDVAGLGDIAEATLSATLTNHVVSGANVLSSQLTDAMEISTLGGTITTDLSDGAKLVDQNGRESEIVAFDVQSVNGIIHVINRVILPNLGE